MTKRLKHPFYWYIISVSIAVLVCIGGYHALFVGTTDAKIEAANRDVLPFVKDVISTVNRLAEQETLSAEDADTITRLEQRGEAIRKRAYSGESIVVYPAQYKDLLEALETIHDPESPFNTTYKRTRAVNILKLDSVILLNQTRDDIASMYDFWNAARYILTPFLLLFAGMLVFQIPEIFGAKKPRQEDVT